MKKALIVVNSFKQEAPLMGKVIASFLTDNGIHPDICSYDGSAAVKNGGECPAGVDYSGYDFVVSLGGDGTVLGVCRGCAPLGIPVFPVNLGNFGFLASVKKNEWKEELEKFLEGDVPVAERSLVNVKVFRNSEKVFECSGMNDIVISAVSIHVINLGVSFNDVALGNFKSDGLIIATATGSTAYSTAAGGPIVDPSIDALLLTPINSFSLSARPLVLSPKGVIQIEVQPSRVSSVLTVDGQIPFALEEGDLLKLSIDKNKARLVCSSQESFFTAMQNKLNWSGGPSA